MSTKVAIDLDGVVFNFTKGMCNFVFARTGNEIKPQQITKRKWHRVKDVDITKQEWDELFDRFVQYQSFELLELFPYARESIITLKNMGCDIHFITKRPMEAKQATANSLKKHGLLETGTLHMTEEKADKAQVIGIQFAVDDDEKYVRQYLQKDIQAYLLKRPYNTAMAEKEEYNAISDLRGFVKVIKNHIQE